MEKSENQDKNNAFLIGLIENDRKVIEEIYDTCFLRILKSIKNSGGNEEDAKDMFQDGLMELYLKKKRDTGFIIKQSFKNYLLRVCLNLWRKKVNKINKNEVSILDKEDLLIEEDADYLAQDIEREQFFWEKMMALDKNCREILKLFFEKKSMKEIAKILNIPNVGTAKKRKFDCKKKLVDSIKNDPKYREL